MAEAATQITSILLTSYEYAKRGACLALVGRREDRLQTVASKTRQIGSPDVIVIPAARHLQG
ncbi:hypothetical protein RJ639_020021 [Escallonia herrerae]|uniref:Uncharacterized protein n=1 Tax=Escallonia herrerae TaxID=1293975 RepID=A0AA89AII2_9ASTE|nr:hypothetical protein RJ639_020021 [Escallonia herrerae]